MKQLSVLIICLLCPLAMMAQRVTSPNGRLSIKTKGQQLFINYEQQEVLELTDFPFGDSFASFNWLFVRNIKEDYQMLTGKRLHCTNEANEYQTALGKNVRLVLRLYNDGVAFRYEYTGIQGNLPPEHAYVIPEGTKRWMQQWCDSYEGFFPLDTTCQVKPVPSYSGVFKSAEGWNNRWGYPALIEPQDGVFALITEANIEKGQSASCLYNEGERFRVTPDETINFQLSTFNFQKTPWRVIVIGSLEDVVQSTLVTDVSNPCQIKDTSWIHPGVVSWIYWAYNHGSNDYDIIKKYVDMAVTLHLPYVLIDAEWDTMKAPYTIEDAVNYAKSKGIKPLIWYN